jgi:dTMP kinase
VSRRRGGKAKARPGRLLVLEGLDGAGTTTQAHLLGGRLRAEGRTVHVTAEPSGGPVGALVRQVLTRRIAGGAGGGFDPAALALLFAADRLDHHAVEIAPKLAEGIDVVSDRYTLSSLAYQGLALDDLGWVEVVNGRAPPARLTLFLRVRPAVALRRRQAASLDREIFEVSAFQRRVAASYDRGIAALRARGEEVVELDGEASVDAVADAIWGVVRGLR